MAKKPEDFKKRPGGRSLDRGLKTKILQLEKRFVEAELAVNQIKDLVKSVGVESLPELKERIEDLEDLIMVENVGVTELKKMLIALNEKMDKPPKEVVEKIEKLSDRVLGVERGLDAIPPPKEAEIPPKELDALRKDIQGVNAQIEALRSKVESMKPSTSIGLLVKRVEELREEVKPRITAIERDLAVVKEKSDTFSVPENIITELAETKNAFSVNNAKLEAVENVVKDITSDVEVLKKDVKSESHIEGLEKLIEQFGKELDEMRPSIKRLESFEKIANLKRDVEWKLEEFRVIESEMKRLADRTEAMHSNIDKRLDIIKGLETTLPELRGSINKLKKEIDNNKIALGSAVKREDIADLIKRNMKSFKKFEKRLDKLKEDVKEATTPLADSIGKFDRRLNMLEETQGEAMEKIGSVKTDANAINELGTKLDRRINMLEETQGDVMKGMEGMTKSLESSKIDIKIIGELKKGLDATKSRLDELSMSVGNLGSKVESIDKKVSTISPKIPPKLEYKKTVDELTLLMNKRLAELQEPAAILNTQVADLLDKVVFLESRLGAIESEMQKKTSIQPIILE